MYLFVLNLKKTSYAIYKMHHTTTAATIINRSIAARNPEWLPLSAYPILDCTKGKFLWSFSTVPNNPNENNGHRRQTLLLNPH